MYWLWVLLAAAQCTLLYVLVRTGQRLPLREARDARANDDLPQAQWPSVGLVIPVAGSDARMERALRSLLAQDYPRVTPVLVTQSPDDPAVEIIARLARDFPAMRHVSAGVACGCGQKNWNSLRGVEALGDTVDVYAFCDSTHLARPDFLRHLVGPIARSEAMFSTGYHMVEPGDEQRVTLAYALCVLLMRLLQALSPFTQLWGGAMSMTRAAWEQQNIARLWHENVVDDCSLSALLQARGVPVRLCPGALLRTRAAAHSRSVWHAWMDRQVLFLKFCMPGQWILLGGLCAMMLTPILCAAVSLLGGLVHLGSGAGVLLSLLWLAGILFDLHLWRGMLSRPVSLWPWFLAFVEAAAMFAWVYLDSLRARALSWHGIRYDVGRGGRVLRTDRR